MPHFPLQRPAEILQWKSQYEEVMEERRAEFRSKESTLRFLESEKEKMADTCLEQFRKGMAAGEELMAKRLREAKEELAIVEEELEDALYGVADDTDEANNDNIFIDPNDSPSRSPKRKKKKKKSKWGGDRVSAK